MGLTSLVFLGLSRGGITSVGGGVFVATPLRHFQLLGPLGLPLGSAQLNAETWL